MTPVTGRHTAVFQQGVSPNPFYSGASDAILANDLEAEVNLGGIEHLELFFGEGQEHRRSLLRWDLSSLPDDAVIHSATLELYRYDGSAENGMPVVLQRLSRDWAEGTGVEFWPGTGYVPDGATWSTTDGSTTWTTPGGDAHSTILAQITQPAGLTNGWITFDATAAVSAWVEESAPNFGVLLRPLAGDYTYHYFASREHATAWQRPRLMVTYAIAGPTPPAPTPSDWIYLPLILRG